MVYSDWFIVGALVALHTLAWFGVLEVFEIGTCK